MNYIYSKCSELKDIHNICSDRQTEFTYDTRQGQRGTFCSAHTKSLQYNFIKWCIGTPGQKAVELWLKMTLVTLKRIKTTKIYSNRIN